MDTLVSMLLNRSSFSFFKGIDWKKTGLKAKWVCKVDYKTVLISFSVKKNKYVSGGEMGGDNNIVINQAEMILNFSRINQISSFQ